MEFFRKLGNGWRFVGRTLYKYNKYVQALVALFYAPLIIWGISVANKKTAGQYNAVYGRSSQYVLLGVLVLFFYSAFRILIIYDKTLRQPFGNQRENGAKNKLRYIFRQKSFWIRAGLLAIPYLLLPLKLSCTVLYEIVPKDSFVEKLPIVGILILLLFCIGVLAYLSAMRVWIRRGPQAVYSNRAYVRTALEICVAYLLCAEMSTSGMFPSILWNYSPFFSGEAVPFYRKVLPIVLFWVLLVLVVRVVSYYQKRRAFLRELQAVCKRKGIRLSPLQKPYLSVFWKTPGETFHFFIGDKRYSCKVMASLRRSLPTMMGANGTLTYLHVIRLFRVTVLQFQTRQDLQFSSEGQKIVIWNPTPLQLQASQDGKAFSLDNGDYVGNYRVYSATAFLHAVERDVLDRK